MSGGLEIRLTTWRFSHEKLSSYRCCGFLTALIAGPSWGYTPGTYEASAQGMKGPVKVAVTFSKDAVTSVKVIEEKETAGIGTAAAAELPRQIVEAQSTKIDGLSGATVTSKAIFAAVEDCIRQAKGDPNQPARSTAPKHAGKTIEAAEDVVIIGSGFQDLPLPSTLLSTVPA